MQRASDNLISTEKPKSKREPRGKQSQNSSQNRQRQNLSEAFRARLSSSARSGCCVSKPRRGTELDFAGTEAAGGGESQDGEKTIENQGGEEEPGGIGKAVGL